MDMNPGEITRRLQEYEHPTWGYRRGENGEIEKSIFDGKLEPGWHDSPANVDEEPEEPEEPEEQPPALPAHSGPPPAAKPVPNAKAGDVVVVPLADRRDYDAMSYRELQDAYSARALGNPVGMKATALVAALKALDGAP